MDVTSIKKKFACPAAVVGTVGAAMTPALAFAEGETVDVSGVNTALTSTATTVATNAISMINSLLPVLAPIIAALIIVRIGMRFIKRNSQ